MKIAMPMAHMTLGELSVYLLTRSQTIFPFPITESAEMRKDMGGSLFLLANLYSVIHSTGKLFVFLDPAKVAAARVNSGDPHLGSQGILFPSDISVVCAAHELRDSNSSTPIISGDALLSRLKVVARNSEPLYLFY